MKKLLPLLFLFLPVASFAEETADDMTTIFEEHFDGWLYLHETGMNATYEYKKASLQSYTIQAVPNDVPCLKLNPGTFFITISNNTGAYGDLILYFKDHNKNTEVSIWQGNKYNTINTAITMPIVISVFGLLLFCTGVAVVSTVFSATSVFSVVVSCPFLVTFML